MNRILLILTALLAGVSSSFADSIPAAHKPETYDFEKWMDYVANDMAENDTAFTEHLLQNIDRKVDQRDVRERLKADFLTELISQSIAEDPQKYIKMADADITTDSLRKKVDNAYRLVEKKYGPIWAGKPAPDFTFTDTKGKVLSLKDFRGKYLFIDFWGTVCTLLRRDSVYGEVGESIQRQQGENYQHCLRQKAGEMAELPRQASEYDVEPVSHHPRG